MKNDARLKEKTKEQCVVSQEGFRVGEWNGAQIVKSRRGREVGTGDLGGTGRIKLKKKPGAGERNQNSGITLGRDWVSQRFQRQVGCFVRGLRQ